MTTIKVRRDTAANWASTNPVLADGERGYDKTNKVFKTGDGVTAWASLPIEHSGTYAAKVRPCAERSIVPVSAAATISATGAQTLATLWRASDPTANGGVVDGTYAYSGFGMMQYGTTGTRPEFVIGNSLSLNAGLLVSPLKVSFVADAAAIEVKNRQNNGTMRVWVDDQLVSGTAVSFLNDGSTGFTKITFADKRPRRVDLELYNAPFGGVVTAATDQVWPAPMRGPRTVVIGDSFAEGTGADASSASAWTRAFQAALGWDDVLPSAIGGTGYLTDGSYARYRTRLTADVIAYNPQVIVWSGGINDYVAQTPAAVGTEVAACLAAAKAALPNVLQVVCAPFFRGGVETMQSAGPNLIAMRDAMKTAALAAGALWVDLLEMPLSQAAVSTTASASAIATATTVQVAAPIPVGATIEFAASRQRRVVTNKSGSGPYTLTVAALTSAVSSGEVVTTVGPSLWTGSGKVGATTGAGSSDIYVSSDGTHPTQAGHNAIGTAAGRLLAAQLSVR